MQTIVDETGRYLGHLERALAMIAGVFVMLLMVLVCAEVFGRSALNQPIRGVIDMVSQLMAVVAAGGVAWCQSRFGNVRMTILTSRLSGRRKWLAEAFSLGIAAWVVWSLTRGSFAFFLRAWRGGSDTPEIGFPTWIGIAFVTLGLGLLLARLLLQLVEALRLIVSPTASSAIFNIPASPHGTVTIREV